jgi:CubicO group peptidase (beta-lactamase class C family)
VIPASDDPFPLPDEPRDLSAVQYEADGETFGLEAFRQHNHVAGLLVLDHGAIVLEQYAFGNTRETTWVSFSVAKSVVSMLLGAAIQDGYINSVDQPVTDYVPSLRGSSYEGVNIRDAVRMASGVAWNEDYTDPASDVGNEIGLTSLERLAYLGNQSRPAPSMADAVSVPR